VFRYSDLRLYSYGILVVLMCSTCDLNVQGVSSRHLGILRTPNILDRIFYLRRSVLRKRHLEFGRLSRNSPFWRKPKQMVLPKLVASIRAKRNKSCTSPPLWNIRRLKSVLRFANWLLLNNVMSEYQYYEFQAIDRVLTREEMAVIDKISSRTSPTPSMAAFTYHYGDFKADEEEILTRYYDAMLYMSNWGTRRLMFRFAAKAVDFEAMRRYAVGDLIGIKKVGDFVILDISPYNEEPSGGWLEGEGILSQMLSLRADLIARDYRTLYLAWLVGIDICVHADEDLEPPVPDGLGELGTAHETFIDFFELREDLVAVAATSSKPLQAPQEVDLKAQIALLTAEQKDDYLFRLAQGEPGLQAIFRQCLQGDSNESVPTENRGHRSAADLQQLGEEAEERRVAATKAAKEKARIEKLQKVVKQKDALWKEVYALIDRRTPRNYADAVEILIDLKAAAEMQGALPAFQARIAELRLQYKSLSSLRDKMKEAGL
jgi:hypothetical protein